MIKVNCPTGCAIPAVMVPFRLKHEPIKCRNCTAWYKIDDRCEDGAYVDGILVARAGRQPSVFERKGRSLVWLSRVLYVVVLEAAIVAAVVALRGRVQLDALTGPIVGAVHVGAGWLAGCRVTEAAIVGGAACAAGAWWLHEAQAFPWILPVAATAGALLVAAGAMLRARAR